MTSSYRTTMWLSSAVGGSSAVDGLLVAFYADAPTGAAIVLVALGVYCATVLVRTIGSSVRSATRRRREMTVHHVAHR